MSDKDFIIYLCGQIWSIMSDGDEPDMETIIRELNARNIDTDDVFVLQKGGARNHMDNYYLFISNYFTKITYNDAEKVGIVYTCNTALIRKMDKLISERPKEIILDREDSISKTYIVSKKWIKIIPTRIFD